mgnify:CR=1 FL=1
MDRFNPRHFAFLILATSIVSLKTYPTIFIADGGRDSWIAMIIASIIAFLFFTYLIKVCIRKNSFDLHSIYHKAVGKTFGNILLGLFIFTMLMTLVESAAVEANSMHTNMFIETPTWYLLLFFIVPIIYTIRKDIVAIITVTMIGIVLIMIAGINLSILTSRYKSFKLLLPILENGLNKGIFIAIIKILGLYGSVSICLPYLSKLGTTEKMTKAIAIGLLIVIQMQIVSTVGLIMTFGPKKTITFSYPKLIQTQQVSYFRFLTLGELYVMLQILGGWMLKYLVTFYGILIILKGFNLKRKHLIYLTYIISGLVYGAAYFISKNLFVLFKFLNYYAFICLINFVIIPLIVFIIFSIRTN